MDFMVYVWIGLIVVFMLIEAATLGLTTIWFAIGSVFAMIAALLNWSVSIQIGIVIVISFILFFFTRPVALKYLKVGHEKTNVNAVIGKKGIVTKGITANETGQVKVEGQIWTAVEKDGKNLDKNIDVEVVKVEGVKLVVKEI